MLQIKSDVFKDMVVKSVKGCGNNKLIPITSLMGIKVENGILTLQTTDAVNYLYIRHKIETDADTFNVTVPAELFSKLIARMTSETIILIQKESILQVKGNGDYKVELPVDENGDLIKYPDPLAEVVLEEDGDQVDQVVIKRLLTTLKPALAQTLENPCYTGYYVGDHVIATDTFKVADLDSQLFVNSVLLSSEMVDLLGIITDETINVNFFDNAVAFTSSNCDVYGTLMDGIEDFNVDAITELVERDIDCSCKVPKDRLLRVLERLALFVSPYDENGINVTFTQEGIEISSKSSTGVEVIPYSESKDFKEFTCCVDVEMLMSVIKAQVCDMLEINYGDDNFIKFKDDDVTLIISLLDQE